MIIIITGPTCTGKSDTALEVAKVFNAEIVNGDAFQCYKELEIGVAKPPKQYFDIVPHHLYSFVEVDECFSIADYQLALRKCVDEIIARGKNVIIVGGSGLYIRAALYDYIFNNQPKVDMSKYEALTNDELHNELSKVDPKQATIIHKNNRKRLLRAIEIYLANGITKSEIIESQEHKLMYNAQFFVRDIERDELYKLIEKRVDKMIDEGLLNEVGKIAKTYGEKCRSLQAIGYKELIPVIRGEYSLEKGIELIKKNSRNYAKRQLTFIRHQFPVKYYKNTADLLEILKK